MAKSMNGVLPMFSREISPAIGSVISSPASGAGRLPFDSPDGRMIEPSGPAVAPVSPSRAPAPKLGATIRATFGRRGFASSASAALQSSLVSKLRQQLDMDGSILFAMTWKEKVTPAGRSVSLLRASGRRTLDNGYGSWPTVQAHDASRRMGQIHRTGGRRRNLEDYVMLTKPFMDVNQTPGKTEDGQDRQKLEKIAEVFRESIPVMEWPNRIGWPTPTKQDGASSGAKDYPASVSHHTGVTLTDASRLTGIGLTSSGSHAETAKPGQLNPAFSLWLQGYPAEWVSCGALAMQSCRKLPRRS